MNVWHDIDPARIKPEDFLAAVSYTHLTLPTNSYV